MIKRTVVDEVPATLAFGAELYVNVGGVLTKYVGNPSNEPIPVKGFLQWTGTVLTEDGASMSVEDVNINELGQTLTFNKNADGRFDSVQTFDFAFIEEIATIYTGSGVVVVAKTTAAFGNKLRVDLKNANGTAYTDGFGGQITFKMFI